MGMLKEFKEFAVKGNVMDMAVGVIIGAAFGKIVTSFVADVLMPPIGMALGKMDLSRLALHLSDQPNGPMLKYGVFLNTVIDFVIVAFAVFMMIRALNRMKRTEAPAPVAAPTTKDCAFCCNAIPVKATRCPHCTSQIAA